MWSECSVVSSQDRGQLALMIGAPTGGGFDQGSRNFSWICGFRGFLENTVGDKKDNLPNLDSRRIMIGN